MKGAEALAIPLEQLGGTWRRTKNETQATRLFDLVNYLENISPTLLTPAFMAELTQTLSTSDFSPELSLNIEQLRKDVFEKKFWFDSNVPEGYGVGSSGTLIAALYENYATEKEKEITVLKKQLGSMESFFHGTSSGFDPLVSYLKKPIHIHRGGEMEILERKITSPLSIFLIDTHQPRKTETYVNLFLEKYCDKNFADEINNNLIPESDAAINFFLENKSEALFDALHQISWFQFRFFSEFIPSGFRDIWLESLSSQHFKIKLCGAGGGGFLLCFSKDAVAMEVFLKGKCFTFLKV